MIRGGGFLLVVVADIIYVFVELCNVVLRDPSSADVGSEDAFSPLVRFLSKADACFSIPCKSLVLESRLWYQAFFALALAAAWTINDWRC